VKGKARIGWSRDDRHDLRRREKKWNQKRSFTSDEKEAWSGNHFFLGTHPEDVQVGDLLFYRNQPTRGRITVVQVAGKYGYLSVQDDFRSYRPCRKLVEGRTLRSFPTILRERLKKPGRFSRIKNDSAVRHFYGLVTKGTSKRTASKFEERGRKKVAAALKKLGNNYGSLKGITPEQFQQGVEGERFVLELLSRKNGWRGLRLKENGDRRQESCGYDFLCTRLADGQNIEVEVKTFAKNGRMFFTQKEWLEAEKAGNRYWLVGVLAAGRSTKTWVAERLPNPYRHLIAANYKVMTVLTYFMSANAIFPEL